MAPTTPYVTPTLAAMLMQNIFMGQVPQDDSAVTNTVMSQLITWTDGIINGMFKSVGYVVPFEAITGETWPIDQTVLLQIMSAVGCAAMASGHILLPAPRMIPGREGGQQNVYAAMFRTFQTDVKENGAGFRANYRLGTKAEKWNTEPVGPRTDFYDGHYDPTRFELLRAYTERLSEVFSDIQEIEIDWDYLYTLVQASSD